MQGTFVSKELEDLKEYIPFFKESFDRHCSGLFDAEIKGDKSGRLCSSIGVGTVTI